jgi:hypothetical protein
MGSYSFESVAKKFDPCDIAAKNVGKAATSCTVGIVNEDNSTELKKPKKVFEASISEHHVENSTVVPSQQLPSFSDNGQTKSKPADSKVSLRVETHEDLNNNCDVSVTDESDVLESTETQTIQLKFQSTNAVSGDDQLGEVRTPRKIDSTADKRYRNELRCAVGFDLADEETFPCKATDGFCQTIAKDGYMNDDSDFHGDDKPFVSLTSNLSSEES